MPLALLSALLLCAAAAQSSLVAGLDLAGGKPDLVLLAVLAWAILRGPSEGVVGGRHGCMRSRGAHRGPVSPIERVERGTAAIDSDRSCAT